MAFRAISSSRGQKNGVREDGARAAGENERHCAATAAASPMGGRVVAWLTSAERRNKESLLCPARFSSLFTEAKIE